MSAVIQAQLKALRLNHPELGVPCSAAVVGNWFDEQQRFVGHKLQFQGEDRIRHLYFHEIRQLQGVEVS